MLMTTVPFYLGEDKCLTFQVTARDGRSFSILSASWKFLDRYDEKVLSGTGEIDDANGTIRVQIKPTQKGSYVLEVEYLIGLETLIERVKIEVC